MRTKLRVVLAVALLPLLASASEIVPGTIQVSGGTTLGFSSATAEQTLKSPGFPDVREDTDIRTFDIEVGTLYYLTNMVGVGLDLGYGSREAETRPITVTETELFIGPKVGIDVPVAERIAVFGDLAIGYVKESFEEQDATDPFASFKYEPTGWGLRIGGGVKFFPLKSLSLDAGLTYRYTSVSYDVFPDTVETRTGGIGGRVGLSIYFGN